MDRKMEDETCSYTTARADEARTLKAPFTTVDERRKRYDLEGAWMSESDSASKSTQREWCIIITSTTNDIWIWT